jgi:predicted enzyme related to lactoylglutathione lyase
MESSAVNAVLFAKDLEIVAAFYIYALGLACVSSDRDHQALCGHGFSLVIRQVPAPIAAEITIKKPPERRVWGAIRLSFPVSSIEDSRRAARSLGGEIDDVPPAWAGGAANFFLGYDPEGNVFGVSQSPG